MNVLVSSDGNGTVVVVDGDIIRELVLGADGSVSGWPFGGDIEGFVAVNVEDLPEYGAYFDEE